MRLRPAVLALVALIALACGASCSTRPPATSGVARQGASASARALPEPRSHYSMTALPSGKVLVAGGKTPTASATASAWLYDLDSGAWEPTGAMSTARVNHGAVLLLDGRVLAMAGSDGTQALASAELYDPETGAWEPAGALSVSRYYFSATLVADGKVLVAGGVHPGATNDSTASCELYDPATGGWSPAAALPEPRSEHTGTAISNGRVLVAGGQTRSGGTATRLASAVTYDPVFDQWTPVASLGRARYLHTASALPDGKVLVAGGFDASAVASVERYDPAADAWTPAAPLATARFAHAAAPLPDGALLVAGGFAGAAPIASAERYDPVADAWSAAGTLGAARAYLRAAVLPDGRVFAGPGWQGGAAFAGNADLIDVLQPSWGAGPHVHAPRLSGAAVALLPGRTRPYDGAQGGPILVAGGRDAGGAPRADAELFDTDPYAGEPEQAVTVAMPVARADFTATVLPSRRVLLIGGEDGAGVLARVDALDLGTPYTPSFVWTTAEPLGWARAGHTATLLRDGTVLVAGGHDWDGIPITTAERYDPRTGHWSAAGAPASARVGHAATLLRDGRVLVTGGDADELYDPSSSGWATAAAQAGTGRSFHTATLLLDGRVLVAGGLGGDGAPLATAALWDPAGATSAPGSPAIARGRHRAVLLPTGQVLVAGGVGAGGGAEATAELFDPATQSWRAAPSMALARGGGIALTLTPQGGALAVGGAADETATERFSSGTHPPAPDAPGIGTWPLAIVSGRRMGPLGISPGAHPPGDGADGSPGSGNLLIPSVVLLRSDGQGAARAPVVRPGTSWPDHWQAPDVGSGPAWGFPIHGGALGDGQATIADPPLGWRCELDSQCAVACVDGVCCDGACAGGGADCQACSAALGAAVDGACGPVAAGTLCRAGAGPCDAAETCDGSSAGCPADAFVQAGTTCRAAAGVCDVAEACTGSNAGCPADAFVQAGTTCRAAAGVCDVAEVCSGTAPECGADAHVPDGTRCLGGDCQAGACVLPPPPPRQEHGGCGTDGAGAGALALAGLAALRRRGAARTGA